MRRPFRLMVIAVAVAASAAVSWGTALATTAPGGSTSRTGVLHVQNSASGCNANYGISVKTTRDPNGYLNTVYATATSKVTCSAGLADFMYNTPSVQRNRITVQTGKTSNCGNPCSGFTYSSVSHLCTERPIKGPGSYVFCYGSYRAEAHFIIILQSQYVWTPPPPKGCTISAADNHTLTCTEYSPSVYVPLT